MSRLREYLAYHAESTRAQDIDPSHNLMLYVCDRFELNVEQRYWLAFLYGLTYCGASVYYLYNEFPDYENVDIGRMNRWWANGGRQATMCQTDRRWVRSSNMFVPAVQSYQRMLNGMTQQEFFTETTAVFDSPEGKYREVYDACSRLHSFGQFALFLYLEAIHTITPTKLAPTDLDLSKAWSCRNGLVYAYEMDQWLTDREMPTPAGGAEEIAKAWDDVRIQLAQVTPGTNVWNIETTLCAYRKYRDGLRYLGYYVDRQGREIAKMQQNVPQGVNWDVLWQFRDETYDDSYLVERVVPVHKLAKGVPPDWKLRREIDTRRFLEGASGADSTSHTG